MKVFGCFLAAMLVCLARSVAGESGSAPRRAPASLELRDQYDAPQGLSFPATNVVVLTIADKKGSEQIEGWVVALKARYAGRIELRGLADVGGVPGFLRGRIRKQFQQAHTHPIMMDWSGTVCAQFGFRPGLANVIVLEKDGTIRAHLAGPAREPAIQEVADAIDAAIRKPPPPAGSKSP